MERAASRRSPFIGKTAAAFELPDQDDRTVSLEKLRGRWVVLYFYPADDTPGCTCQATEFTKLLKRFREQGAEIYGVSPDLSASHRYFRDKYELEIALLSDPHHEVMRRYGAWLDLRSAGAEGGRVVRSTFLIDPTGRIAHHWPEVIPQGHAKRVADRLRDLSS
ncbi:MAG: peroxiredoxin [Phycisphaeraceae bacterium]|nr:peroxiredoxin [Phycisphaeraceae bacterium]